MGSSILRSSQIRYFSVKNNYFDKHAKLPSNLNLTEKSFFTFQIFTSMYVFEEYLHKKMKQQLFILVKHIAEVFSFAVRSLISVTES